MKIQFFKPDSELLQEYLEGYYFLSHSAETARTSYLTFPNNFAILSVCDKVSVQHDQLSVFVSGQEEGHFVSELITHFRKPASITYEGKVEEITFYFKPLGLNAFLPEVLSSYTSEYFSAFHPYDDYRSAMQAALEEPDTNKRRKMIETYWLNKLQGFTHPLLQNIVKALQQPGNTDTLEKTALKFYTSRQYIHEQFKLHLCKTPVAFRKTQRFREAMSASIDMNRKGTNLTSLSYEALFYDQSHLIKDFKAFTGMTPKKLLQAISFQEDAMINWLYL